MAAGSVTCLLILLLIAAWISIAQASQGGINPDYAHKVPTGRKVILKGLGERATKSKNLVGGRKMVVETSTRHMKDAKMSAAADVGGSTYSKSKCDDIHLGCEQTVVSNFSDEVLDESSAGFVAFNADYHAPRHHPPKNN